MAKFSSLQIGLNSASINALAQAEVSSTFTLAGGSGGTSTAPVLLSLLRVGNVVFLNIPAISITSGTSNTSFTSNTAIPAEFRPSVSTYSAALTVNTGAEVISKFGVSTAGILTLTAAFSNTITVGIPRQTMMSWSVL